MAGYAVTMTLHRADARIGRPGQAAGADSADTARDGLVEVPLVRYPAAEQVELAGRPFGQELRDWLAALGETWSQLTFYLFDPQSWR